MENNQLIPISVAVVNIYGSEHFGLNLSHESGNTEEYIKPKSAFYRGEKCDKDSDCSGQSGKCGEDKLCVGKVNGVCDNNSVCSRGFYCNLNKMLFDKQISI